MTLAGGVNTISGINNYLDLSKAGFLSPTRQCKPFDASADGYCRSEGADLVVLKKLNGAIHDGDQIMSVIPGVTTNQGGLSASITSPHSTAQQALYRNVLKQAKLQPEQVTYIEAHNTGTQVGDPLEMESIRSIFRSHSRSGTLCVGSIKGNIGHCETAAGIASLLKVLAMIKHGKLPPQANHQRLNPKIPPLEADGLEIARHLRPWNAPRRVALVNSYGAGGSNCALLCSEMPDSKDRIANGTSVQSTPTSYPIILSASSRQSLLNYVQSLSPYLHQHAHDLAIRDVSFTLNERRRRQKYYLTTMSTDTEDLAKRLESLEPSIFEYPQDPKPVVLTFSGQYDLKVGLDRSIYENYPTFGYYIDACDTEIRNLDYESIVPTIFQVEPIPDVITLQCGIFAVQYASAQSWIDAGLKVGSILGHSLGELTALAVSGVLSLSDCIKLVAFRGHLIKTKWSLEKGAMLALQGGPDDLVAVRSCLLSGSDNGKLEVACYNAESSLVVVGSSITVDAVIEVLRTDSNLQKINFQRLETTHGFHSILAEPILAELDKMSRSLHWSEPRIPLEICTQNPLKSLQEYSISNHAREPVYFSNAVQRIEHRLGPCVWLEAGIDTPVIAMTRRACRRPEMHTFQAMRTNGLTSPVDAIGEVVNSLWRSGISLTHWTFSAELTPKHKQVWLPPYQFETTSYWLENIDRTIEMQRSLSRSTPSTGGATHPPTPPRLIERKGTTDEFIVNTYSQRFQKILHGHAVRRRPICPASMYMECVTMAVQTLRGDLEDLSIIFEDVNFHSALGVIRESEVTLRLEEVGNNTSWKFLFRSATTKDSKPTNHGNGTICLVRNPMLDTFQRLLSRPIEYLERKQDTEKLLSRRAYGLFASVVNYGHFFQGIHSVALDDWEAIATIIVPEHQPNREESTVWQLCDTVVIDNFIQVLGLLVNSSEYVNREEVMLATGIERVVVLTSCTMNDSEF